MSTTPRTDANTIAGTVILHNGQCTAQLVPSNFARTLEIELAAMQARAEKAEAELVAERKRVRVLWEALENLLDEQNGAPLSTRETEWKEAMDKADAALAATKEASK